MRRRGSSTAGRATGRPFPACTPPLRPAFTPSPAVTDELGATAAAKGTREPADGDTPTPLLPLGACPSRCFLFLHEEKLWEGGGGGGVLFLVRAAKTAAVVAGVPAVAADDSVPVVRPR